MGNFTHIHCEYSTINKAFMEPSTHQPHAKSIKYQLGGGLHSKLGEDFVFMILNRMGTDVQLFGNLLGGFARRTKADDVHFTTG